jgi:hypothetical protein
MKRSKKRPGRSSQHQGPTPPRPRPPQPAVPTAVATPQPSATEQSRPHSQIASTDRPPESQKAGPAPLRKDQKRALKAYEWVSAAANAEPAAPQEKPLKQYEIAVQSFAAALLRSGFAAAVSLLERNKDRSGYRRLLENLADWRLPGIDAQSSAGWPDKVRAIPDVTQYMLATRELILLLNWLRRACRALGDEAGPMPGEGSGNA